MAESPDEASSGFQPQPAEGALAIKKIYCKDISFETPNSPGIFRAEWKPNAEMQLRTDAKETAPGEYEVELGVTVTLTVGEKTAFLAEVSHAGLFGITGMTSEERAWTLGSYCPAILFPYVRELVSDLVTRGGFPPFLLAPVNFEVLYKRHLAEHADAQQAASDSQP